jgi:hypothetical protein
MGLSSVMADLEKCRARARYCERMAEKATHPKDRQSWQTLSETWRDMAWQSLNETWRDILLASERASAIESEQISQELSGERPSSTSGFLDFVALGSFEEQSRSISVSHQSP